MDIGSRSKWALKTLVALAIVLALMGVGSHYLSRTMETTVPVTVHWTNVPEGFVVSTAAPKVEARIKGAAGNLGALTLLEAAARLELSLRREPLPERALLQEQADSLLQACQSLQAALRPLLPAAPRAEPAVSTPDWPAVRDLAERLCALLATDDMASSHLYRDNRAQLDATLGVRAEDFAREIESFSYEEALAILRAAMAEFPGPAPG